MKILAIILLLSCNNILNEDYKKGKSDTSTRLSNDTTRDIFKDDVDLKMGEILYYREQNQSSMFLAKLLEYSPKKYKDLNILLHNAAQKGQLSFIKVLLKVGYDINYKDLEGNTPIIKAIALGHEKVVDFLIQNGADISCKNKEGFSAVDFANREKRQDIADSLNKASRL